MTGERPGPIIERRGMKQVSDVGAIEAIVDRVLAANPDEVEQYRGGQAGTHRLLRRAVMRETGGRRTRRSSTRCCAASWGSGDLSVTTRAATSGAPFVRASDGRLESRGVCDGEG